MTSTAASPLSGSADSGILDGSSSGSPGRRSHLIPGRFGGRAPVRSADVKWCAPPDRYFAHFYSAWLTGAIRERLRRRWRNRRSLRRPLRSSSKRQRSISQTTFSINRAGSVDGLKKSFAPASNASKTVPLSVASSTNTNGVSRVSSICLIDRQRFVPEISGSLVSLTIKCGLSNFATLIASAPVTDQSTLKPACCKANEIFFNLPTLSPANSTLLLSGNGSGFISFSIQ